MYNAKRTRFNWWTPSIPWLESRRPFSSISAAESGGSSLVLALYRSWRIAYLVATTPIHLALVVLSLPPFSCTFPSIFDPEWCPTQRLVYPFLRRIIWALADVGDPNVLTRSTREGSPPLWARALEEFTVTVAGGKRVELTKESNVPLPGHVTHHGWLNEKAILSAAGTTKRIEVEPVNLFWFECASVHSSTKVGLRGGGRFRARTDDERCVMYLFGGGFVCGSPGEGGRCYKIARETGLRVVGVNYRRATCPKGVFPAALQDALSCFFHLTIELGYRDVVLAGDSAGGGLALNVVQYLAGTVYPTLSPEEQERFVLPSALLLISPWCDLTLESFPNEENKTDIILPSICSNSVRAYLDTALDRETPLGGSDDAEGSCKKPAMANDPARHAWFSPSLSSSRAALQAIPKAYANRRLRLRILVSLGTSELFYESLSSLVENLEALDRSGVVVETLRGRGEVHAFPLVPEWVSPGAVSAWERLRIWFKE